MYTKRVWQAALLLLLSGLPSFAILGVGDIVHDPISYINALAMLSELVKSYEQLKAQLELEIEMAKRLPFDMQARYGLVTVPWQGLFLPYDHLNNLQGWLQAVNGNSSGAPGYQQVSVPLAPIGPKFRNLPAREQQRLGSHYASVELADGTNLDSMQAVGALRANARIVEQSIAALELDAHSADPALNTEVAVLNKINSAQVAALRMSRDTNRVLLNVLEQQLIMSKRMRDAEAQELNSQLIRVEVSQLIKAQRTRTLTQSLQSFRWR